MSRVRILIMGAAGRDFHNFNVFFRNRERYEVVAFTATQIPNIEGRVYPPQLAGPLYPKGIPIYTEAGLTELIVREKIDQVVFSYSDVRHEYVMHKASQVLATGADYRLFAGLSAGLYGYWGAARFKQGNKTTTALVYGAGLGAAYSF